MRGGRGDVAEVALKDRLQGRIEREPLVLYSSSTAWVAGCWPPVSEAAKVVVVGDRERLAVRQPALPSSRCPRAPAITSASRTR
jgi:hypothetical protein